MPTHATATDVSTLRTLYLAYVTAMTYASNAAALAIWKQEATNHLNLWADALLGLQNVNASAATEYSSGVGSRFVKQRADTLRGEAAYHFAEFVSLCARGGQTVPSIDTSVSYWDMSQPSND